MEGHPGEEAGEGSHNGGVQVLRVKYLVFLRPTVNVFTHPHDRHLQVFMVCQTEVNF